ncbi:MAG: MotA/TolQ/ExbB proton channel family protein [Saprospiraceae bacterium]|nr:MotA/TolQ/ExbB proton channel family protein [Saprospiraceae bacterium]MDW8484188.1 MotA/TolQ/ExbB proton channel family protein [Saprospiraceae bacterium]
MKTINTKLAYIVLPLSIVVGYLVYTYVAGNPANFVEGNTKGRALNMLGTIYQGGILVIPLLSFQFIALVYIIERYFSLRLSRGRGDLREFIFKVKDALAAGDYSKLVEISDQQQGAVGNVVKTGTEVFLARKATGEIDQKDIYLIQKELEETTQLEVSELTNNMFILGTVAQISTLVGLLGTVTGMIQAFAALARVGEPDPVGLASGISQALVTTAVGITTAAVTIVFYNSFNNQIERITYTIDEVCFSIIHSLKLKFFVD